MEFLEENNFDDIIDNLLSSGIDYTRSFLEVILNDNLDLFNELVHNCNTGEKKDCYLGDDSYRFEKIRTSVVGDMLCVDYDWSTTRTGKKEFHHCTHGYIDLKTHEFRFFQFGQDTKSNKEHQSKFMDLMSLENLREIKIKQLI